MSKRIAVIGSGISGLTAAYLLAKKHHVTVFEKGNRIGGHTATVDVSLNNRDYAIDTGFIVFNNKTYPNFLALLDEIGVDKQETQMSFSVRNEQSGLEYNGHNLATLFAQKRNLINPKFWGLIREILRFNKLCKAIHARQYGKTQVDYEALNLGAFLSLHQFSNYFSQHYILPMGAAIWSTSLADMKQFPLQFFIRFFHNHGLLNIADRPQWYVIPNGSRSYLAPLICSFADNLHLDTKITTITRHNERVQIHFEHGEQQEFDEVVLACHSDQALALLADPSQQERDVLGNIPYSENQVVLHTDSALLPKRRKAWASWNYNLSEDLSRPACVTYNMNILQGINSEHTFCVTLNQTEAINKNKILREFVYHHPVYTEASLNAQQQRHLICGQKHTHYAGAYWYNGFHEDGVKSAVDVAERFNCYLASQELGSGD